LLFAQNAKPPGGGRGIDLPKQGRAGLTEAVPELGTMWTVGFTYFGSLPLGEDGSKILFAEVEECSSPLRVLEQSHDSLEFLLRGAFS